MTKQNVFIFYVGQSCPLLVISSFLDQSNTFGKFEVVSKKLKKHAGLSLSARCFTSQMDKMLQAAIANDWEPLLLTVTMTKASLLTASEKAGGWEGFYICLKV